MNGKRLLVVIIAGLLLMLVAQAVAIPDATQAQTRTFTTLLPLPPPPSPTPDYTDVTASTPYQSAILGVGRYGIMTGYSDDTFRPQAPILRAEFAKMMCEYGAARFGGPLASLTEATPYRFMDLGPDIETSLYPHEYVGYAASGGLILGYADGTFRPYVDISRAQAVTIVVRWGLGAYNPQRNPPADFRSALGNFEATHGRNMAQAEYWGLLEGLVGYGPIWDPWVKMTRGEAAQIFWNLLGRPTS